MGKRVATALLSAAAVLVFAAALAAQAGPAAARDTLTGTVTYVFDGDTIRVRLDGGGDRRVRLIGVDSPELDDPRERARFLSFAARRFAHTRLHRQKVSLILDKEKEDAYGRLLAFIRLRDGTVFNEVLVREGFASAYLKFPFDEHWRKRLKAAEREARNGERGMWRKEPYPVIEAAGAGSRLGEIVTVRFRCVRSFDRSRLRILEADKGAFDAVIPAAVLKTLPGSLDFQGLTLEVTGFVEEFRGRPQIMIGVPMQIKRVD